MTKEEFDLEQAKRPCLECGRSVSLESNPNNGALQVVCSDTTCRRWRRPWKLVVNLKQTMKTRRAEYPMGASLEEVWAEFGDVCVVCSAPKSFLIQQGIGRQRQHVQEYAKHGHQGRLVPMCVPCHENATQRQKLFWFWYRRVGGQSEQPVPGSGAGLSPPGLSPDSLRPARETAPGALEGFPDDDAKP